MGREREVQTVPQRGAKWPFTVSQSEFELGLVVESELDSALFNNEENEIRHSVAVTLVACLPSSVRWVLSGLAELEYLKAFFQIVKSARPCDRLDRRATAHKVDASKSLSNSTRREGDRDAAST